MYDLEKISKAVQKAALVHLHEHLLHCLEEKALARDNQCMKAVQKACLAHLNGRLLY